MILFIFPAIVITILILFVDSIKYYYRHYKLAGSFPGPPAYPIIGNLNQFFKLKPPEIFARLIQNAYDYGDNFRLWIGPKLHFIISNPEDAEGILSSQVFLEKSVTYDQLKPWLNTGLLLSSGQKWHQRRKLITPTFHFKILENFIDVFERQGAVFIKILERNVDGRPFELYPLITLYALDVICETAMGTTINAQMDAESNYVKAVKDESHVMHSRTFNIALQNEFIYKFTKYAKMEKNALNILHGFTDSVIQARKQELINQAKKSNNINENADDEDVVGTKRKEMFLDLLLKSNVNGKPLSDSDIREEVDTFMFEGHDTTTSAITFIMYNIAKHAKCQAKCAEELSAVFGDDLQHQATYQELTQLNYLEKVIKESLRLYPSVPTIGRKLNEDATINGKLYPAGSNLIIQIFAMNHNPKLFRDPEVFRPERFDNPEFSTFSFVPFSAGPRNCIGQKFAMLEMKSVIAKILRNYRIELADESQKLVLYSETILRPWNPLFFKISKRIH